MWRGTMRFATVMLVVLGSVAAGRPASADTNLLRNGGFEWPSLGGNMRSRQFDAGQRIGSWRVTAGSVVTTTASPVYETPPVGLQAINLRPALELADGEICQTASGLVPGGAYKIRLLAASVIEESAIDVTFDGVEVGHLDLLGGVPVVFKLYVWRVTAAASTAPFCLHGHPIGPYGYPIVDGVRIKPVTV